MKRKIIKIALLFMLVITYHCFAMVDPTRPPTFKTVNNTPVVNIDDFTLNAIFIYPNRRLAIINNQQVSVGDKLNEYTVTRITKYTVELVGPSNNKEVLQLTRTVKQAHQP